MQRWHKLVMFVFVMFFCSTAWAYAEDVYDLPQIVKASDGSMIAVWQLNDDGMFSILAATYNPLTTTWGAPTTISTANESSFGPRVYMNGLDNVVVGYTAINTTTGTYNLKVAMKLFGSSWGTPATVCAATHHVQSFSLKVDESGTYGTVTATWVKGCPATGPGVFVSTAAFGGNWDTPTQIQ